MASAQRVVRIGYNQHTFLGIGRSSTCRDATSRCLASPCSLCHSEGPVMRDGCSCLPHALLMPPDPLCEVP